MQFERLSEGRGTMESQTRPAAAWYELRDDLPDGEVLVPVLTKRGTVIAVRKGEMTEALCAELNKMLTHLIGNHIWEPGVGADPSLTDSSSSKE